MAGDLVNSDPRRAARHCGNRGADTAKRTWPTSSRSETAPKWALRSQLSVASFAAKAEYERSQIAPLTADPSVAEQPSADGRVGESP